MLSRLQATAATFAGWGISAEQAARRVVGHSRGPEVRWQEGGAGAPLVLINGFGVDGRVWPGSWVRQLERGYRVIRIDDRGTGRDGQGSAPRSIADLADDVAQALDAGQHAEATVLGLSMGGMIAQEFAVRHPDRVRRLCLVSTIPAPPQHVPTANYGPMMQRALGRGIVGSRSWADLLTRFYLGSCSPRCTLDRDLVHELTEQVRRQPFTPMHILQQVRAIAAWRDPERFAAITAPTTIVAGRDDPLVKVVNSERLAALIPGSRLVTLAGVGHLVPWEAPDELTRLLTT